MKKLTVVLAVVWMTGCSSVVTLNPVYSGDREVVQDLPIEGVWADGDDNWEIRREGNGYTVTQENEHFKAHMTAIGGDRYLDIEPVDAPALTVAVHMIVKVRMEQDNLCVAIMDSEWLRDQLKTIFPMHSVQRGDGLLLTAETAELRRMVERYGSDPRAFGDTETMARVR